jgi:hypothetical protein
LLLYPHIIIFLVYTTYSPALKMDAAGFPKLWQIPTRLHDIAFQKNSTLLFWGFPGGNVKVKLSL